MKVLVVGRGGREHAIAWKLALSPNVERVYIAPGNGGTSLIGENIDIDTIEIVRLSEFARDIGVGLVVVGPELPLALGLADELKSLGVPAFGPTRLAAQIEASKAFAKEFMSRHDIPTARFEIAESVHQVEQALKKLGTPCVIKADGLAAGKGAFIVETKEDALKVADHLIEKRVLGDAGKRVVVEAFLSGIEVSFQVITDGYRILPLATSQDFKRAYDHDEGPNTGGMGAYSPAFFMTSDLLHEVIQRIMKPAIQGLESEGRVYTGVLYAGLMLTSEGPKVLEFNCRLGDPETQVVLPRLETDFAEICEATVRGELSRIVARWSRSSCLCVVLASGGYPGKYEKGYPIEGLEDILSMEDVMVFHAGTKRGENGQFYTDGGRVLNVVAMGPTLKHARERAYRAIEKIRFENMHYRKDIGETAIKMIESVAKEIKKES